MNKPTPTADPSVQAFMDLATETMTKQPGIVAVVTMLVDSSGVVRPAVSTKDLPDHIGHNLRVNITNVMVTICAHLFGRRFRCGCVNCTSPEAEAGREVLEQMPHGWSTTKAQA